MAIKRTIERQTKFLFGVFILTTITIFAVHIFWIWPGQRCEQSGHWWDWRTRVCASPILISDITGRVIKNDAARDAARAMMGKGKALSGIHAGTARP